MLAFGILGPFEVVDGERRVVLGGPKQRALLAILLLRRGEAVSSDRLIDQLWGERPPVTAAKTLQGYVSHLRKALGDDVLLTRGGGYLLVVASGQVDVDRFEAMAADARRALADGDAARAREVLTRRWGCGAVSRSPISRMSRSLSARSRGWRTRGWLRWRIGLRRT